MTGGCKWLSWFELRPECLRDAEDEFDDLFVVPLWINKAENRIVGAQLGIRWFRKRGHWALSAEGRLLAGYNGQSIHQEGLSFNSAYLPEWSPVGELRASVRLHLSRAISFRVGWTGIYMDGIARASSMINYSNNGIITNRNREEVFVQGLSIGLDMNY